MLTRNLLLIETYDSRKEKSFRGGVYNLHTPREGHWLPKKVRRKHHEGIYRKSPGKKEKREGSYLKDEPLRHRAEKKPEPISSDILVRTDLLLDHHKPT